MPVGYQFRHILVGQGLSGNLSEQGKGTSRVIASYYLSVELHTPRAAFRAAATGVLVPENLVAGEQFGCNLTGIGFNIPHKCLGRKFATLDFGKGCFPFSRHLHVGDVHPPDNGIKGKPLFGRHENLLGAVFR